MAESTFMQRVLKARKEIMESGISKDKSGFKFKYVDLPQIETKVNEACFNNDIFVWFDFSDGKATLKLFDARTEAEPFVVSVEPKAVDMKGQQPIQDTGAMITYMRRYLYMTAFQISEHDMIDNNVPAQSEASEETEANPEDGLDDERRNLLELIRKMDPKAPEKMLAMQKKDSFAEIPLEYFQKIYDAYLAHNTRGGENA